MRLLIVGATGGTGRQLVAQALARGHKVTALARRPAKIAVRHEGLVVLPGNVMDYNSLEVAMHGQEAVLCALGHKRWFYPTRILSEGTRNLVRAMETHQVRRLICETSLGLGDSSGRMGLYYTLFVIPFILPFYYWDKRRQEQVIRASSPEWVIVRPGAPGYRRRWRMREARQGCTDVFGKNESNPSLKALYEQPTISRAEGKII